jgi:hypothetical protein
MLSKEDGLKDEYSKNEQVYPTESILRALIMLYETLINYVAIKMYKSSSIYIVLLLFK